MPTMNKLSIAAQQPKEWIADARVHQLRYTLVAGNITIKSKT